MAVHASSSDAGTSAVNTNQISSLPNIQNSLFPFQHLEEEEMNYEELPAFVINYFAGIHEIRYLFPNLQQRLEAAMPEEFDSEKIVVLGDFLAEEMVELWRVHADQLRMQAAHHVHGNGIDAKLDRIGRWRKWSAVFFTTAAAISAAAAVVAANINHVSAAAGGSAAASVLFIAAGKGMDSYLKERESALKKHKDVIRAMIVGGKIAINDLSAIYVLVHDLKFDTASTLKMVSDGAADVAVRKKMATLKQSFQKLQMEVNRCSSDVSSAREAVFQSIIANLD